VTSTFDLLTSKQVHEGGGERGSGKGRGRIKGGVRGREREREGWEWLE